MLAILSFIHGFVIWDWRK